GVLDVAAMRAREAEIWGSTDEPSQVRVRVVPDQIHPGRHYRDGQRFGIVQSSPEAYALFSAIENDVPRLLKEGYEFALELRWPGPAQLAQLRKLRNQQRRNDREEVL